MPVVNIGNAGILSELIQKASPKLAFMSDTTNVLKGRRRSGVQKLIKKRIPPFMMLDVSGTSLSKPACIPLPLDIDD